VYQHAALYNRDRGNRDSSRESVDAYLYRIAENKQVFISQIERVLKQNALDCHLNSAVLTFPKQPPTRCVNSQGEGLKVSLGDTDYTRVCDYMRCDFRCSGRAPDFADPDTSTFDRFFIEKDVEAYAGEVATLFADKVVVTHADIERHMSRAVPHFDADVLTRAMARMVDAKTPVLYGATPGHLIYRSDGYVFQPAAVADQKLTIAERADVERLLAARKPARDVALRAREAPPDGSEIMARVTFKLRSVAATYGRMYDKKTLVDFVVDHLREDELLPVCAAARDDPRASRDDPRASRDLRDSLVRGHVLLPNGNVYNYFTNAFHDGKTGAAFTQYIAKRIELEHFANVRKRLAGAGRHAFLSARDGKCMLKLIYSAPTKHKRQKDAAALTGVVCAAFPQLKKEELVDMIRALNPRGVLPNLNRSQMCDAYELALRSKGMVMRPADNKVYEQANQAVA